MFSRKTRATHMRVGRYFLSTPAGDRTTHHGAEQSCSLIGKAAETDAYWHSARRRQIHHRRYRPEYLICRHFILIYLLGRSLLHKSRICRLSAAAAPRFQPERIILSFSRGWVITTLQHFVTLVRTFRLRVMSDITVAIFCLPLMCLLTLFT